MSERASAATDLARRALEVLNTGNTDAVRVVLESVLDSRGSDAAVVSNSPTSRRRFGRALLACTAGQPYWRQIRHPSSDNVKAGGSHSSGQQVVPSARAEESAVDVARRWLSASRQNGREYVAEAVLFLKTVSAPASSGDGLPNLFAECNYPAWDGTEQQALETLLRSRSVDRRLAEHSTWRLLFLANKAGMTQRQIARLVNEPQATVNRRLRQLESEPERIAVAPSEIVDRYMSEQIDRAEMLSLLAAYPYDRGQHPAGAEEWAYVSGSWDELTRLTVGGDLTAEEFDFIVDAVEERSQHAVPATA